MNVGITCGVTVPKEEPRLACVIAEPLVELEICCRSVRGEVARVHRAIIGDRHLVQDERAAGEALGWRFERV